MAVYFERLGEKITVFFEGSKYVEFSSRRRLIENAEDFIPILKGTQVEEFPMSSSYYIGSAQNVYPSLSAIIFDKSYNGMNLQLMTDSYDLNSWKKPYSFDDYLNKVSTLLNGLIKPIKKYYSNKNHDSINYTYISLQFFVSHGDFIEQVEQHINDYLSAVKKADSELLSTEFLNQYPPCEGYNFIEGQSCSLEENLTTEFKEVNGKDPTKVISRVVLEYIIGFLNSEGGSIFWGICDNGNVKSLTLSQALKDDIRKMITTQIHVIAPAIDPSKIKIFFHKVSNADNSSSDNSYVVEVYTPKSNSLKVYFNPKGETWVKLNGSNQKLQGPALQDFIISRIKKD
ncbi:MULTISPECIES: helix-turn-helix domain-containing protein [Providencia]|uniref:AlbA family DNA-binding domain-containing protein n=1 Tax=Providencia TaxID=586 RepID=UPI0018E47E33|nr:MULTISPECIES: ATP-binding protein [Providencia]EJD6474348.1 ATP-binding protein [Providencia rettgeri]ELU1435831.1 ATP-binding protein [Providencia rettgeri]MBI6193147.1 ATP-binding protein [Providencia rettgeri]